MTSHGAITVADSTRRRRCPRQTMSAHAADRTGAGAITSPRVRPRRQGAALASVGSGCPVLARPVIADASPDAVHRSGGSPYCRPWRLADTAGDPSLTFEPDSMLTSCCRKCGLAAREGWYEQASKVMHVEQRWSPSGVLMRIQPSRHLNPPPSAPPLAGAFIADVAVGGVPERPRNPDGWASCHVVTGPAAESQQRRAGA